MGGSKEAFADEQSRRSGGSIVQRELSPQATEGLFLSCEFCNPSASRRSAPPFTQGRRKVVVVAFATAVQICKYQTFSEGFQPCRHHALIGLSKPPVLPVVMTAARKAFAHILDKMPRAASGVPLCPEETAPNEALLSAA